MTSEWIPIFTARLSDEEILKPTYMFSAVFADGHCICKLCQKHVSGSEREQVKHARAHARELKEWRESSRAAAERAARELKAAEKRERDLERKVLGDELVEGGLPHKKRLYNRITSARYKLKHASTDADRSKAEKLLAEAQSEYDEYVKEG